MADKPLSVPAILGSAWGAGFTLTLCFDGFPCYKLITTLTTMYDEFTMSLFILLIVNN